MDVGQRIPSSGVISLSSSRLWMLGTTREAAGQRLDVGVDGGVNGGAVPVEQGWTSGRCPEPLNRSSTESRRGSTPGPRASARCPQDVHGTVGGVVLPRHPQHCPHLCTKRIRTPTSDLCDALVHSSRDRTSRHVSGQTGSVGPRRARARGLRRQPDARPAFVGGGWQSFSGRSA